MAILQKGIDLLTKATEEDLNHNYEEAVRLYKHGVEYCLSSIQYIKDEEAKECVRVKCAEYSGRIARIKESLENAKKETESLPILKSAIYFVNEAAEEDRNQNYEEALQLYEYAIELFICSIQCELQGEKAKESTRVKCVKYFDRAAVIKKSLEKGRKTSIFSKLNCCC